MRWNPTLAQLSLQIIWGFEFHTDPFMTGRHQRIQLCFLNRKKGKFLATVDYYDLSRGHPPNSSLVLHTAEHTGEIGKELVVLACFSKVIPPKKVFDPGLGIVACRDVSKLF